MYFSYGAEKRAGIKAKSTFEAILNGERTSTTRFDVWPGSDRWGRLPSGAPVRFYEDKNKRGRWVDVIVALVKRVDLQQATRGELEAWSQAEGWSVDHARSIAHRGVAFQVRYCPAEGEIERLRIASKA